MIFPFVECPFRSQMSQRPTVKWPVTTARCERSSSWSSSGASLKTCRWHLNSTKNRGRYLSLSANTGVPVDCPFVDYWEHFKHGDNDYNIDVGVSPYRIHKVMTLAKFPCNVSVIKNLVVSLYYQIMLASLYQWIGSREIYSLNLYDYTEMGHSDSWFITGL